MNASRAARVKLVYPAQQFENTENPRPDGSLGLLYLAGALRDNGIHVSLLDMCVGEAGDRLEDTFLHRVKIDEEHVRVGMSPEVLAERLRGYNILGVTSIFTPQTYNAFEVAQVAKKLDPGILTIAGGGNARAFYQLFLQNGFDLVVFGEGEEALVEIVRHFEQGLSFENIRNVAYRDKNGKFVVNPDRPVLIDLDKLPFPAWDLLPLDLYWKIGEPHGGTFEPGTEVRYLSMQTSRGCPFRCTYCHISKEGDAAKLRLKSYDRVMAEIDLIKKLGVEYLFFEDDSLLAKRERIKKIFNGLRGKGLKVIDVNGVNLVHFFHGISNGKLDVDTELLRLMTDVGWVEVAFPFESGCQRILDKYASKKWTRKRHDMHKLVRVAKEQGLKLSGFFTIGYPDETLEELTETFLFAKQLSQDGIDHVAFYIITPYPGSVLYDMAVANGNVPPHLDLVNMKFAIPTMINTIIPPETLRYTRQLAFRLINPSELADATVSKNVGAPGPRPVTYMSEIPAA